MAGGVSGGTYALRGGHSTAGGGTASAASTAFVVTALVSAQGLPSRERFVADGALVGPPAGDVGGCEGGGGGRGGCGGRSGLVLSRSAAFSVTGLVSAQSLVRREGLVAHGALVAELRRRRLGLWRSRTR